MPAPTADAATVLAASAPSPVTSGGRGPNINPLTGLSTDYLNHFTEAVMMLEMAGAVPECLDDLRAWRPKTYAEHFAASGFSNRDAVIAAYEVAEARRALDATADVLNAMIEQTHDAMLGRLPIAAALAQLHPLIARTAALINGTPAEAADGARQQAAIDAMFDG